MAMFRVHKQFIVEADSLEQAWEMSQAIDVYFVLSERTVDLEYCSESDEDYPKGDSNG